MIKNIVKGKHIFSRKAKPATEADKQVVTDLIDTLRANREICVGMAANMIGVNKSIIVVAAGPFQFAMVNPVITKKSGEYKTEELPRFKLVATMMGKEFDDLADIKGSGTSSKKQSDEVVIEAKGLYHKGTIKPFDIKIHKGEVVGLSGLLGSGRSELVRAIYGADKPDGGELYVKGEKLDVKAPIDAMHKGMAYCPEDRKVEGIIADLSVRENMILALQAKRGMFKLMSRKEQEELTDKYIKMLQVKTASRETPIKSLSGGNQQKVILGRWLMTEPDFLILDEPTRGIDVGTKTEIQKLVVKLANEGMSVVFISSEVEEMLRTVTHMGILRDGEKVGELEESELSQENVMKAIAGGDK